MLIRITLIAAIILGLAAGVLNFVQVKEKINTTIGQRDQNAKDRDEEKGLKQKALKDLASTKASLQRTNDALVAMTTERDTAVAASEADKKAATDLTAALAKTKTELEGTRNDLEAWHALGIPIEKIKATLASLATVTEEKNALATENSILIKENHAQSEKIAMLTDPEHEVVMPAGLRGKVMAVDPRFDFVVLDIGGNQGVLEGGRFLVSEKGKLMAKVQVKSVQPNTCIANVMPGYKVGEVLEGDQVLY